MNQTFNFKAFTNLDNTAEAEFFIDSMDVMSSLPCIQRIKKQAIDLLDLRLGDKVLEAGCGHGEDAEAIAAIIGNQGQVLAIDNSQIMLNEAILRSQQRQVKYILGDINNIPRDDNFFDACHTDRLLVSHHEVDAILKELLRVTRPGGKICITDVDAQSIIIHPFNEVTQSILDELLVAFTNPTIGRRLPEILNTHGLRNIQLVPAISTVRDFETLEKIFMFEKITSTVVDKGVISEIESKHWYETVRTMSAQKSFLYAIMFFTVIGEKPFV